MFFGKYDDATFELITLFMIALQIARLNAPPVNLIKLRIPVMTARSFGGARACAATSAVCVVHPIPNPSRRRTPTIYAWVVVLENVVCTPAAMRYIAYPIHNIGL